jgi:hypothetical protein
VRNEVSSENEVPVVKKEKFNTTVYFVKHRLLKQFTVKTTTYKSKFKPCETKFPVRTKLLW